MLNYQRVFTVSEGSGALHFLWPCKRQDTCFGRNSAKMYHGISWQSWKERKQKVHAFERIGRPQAWLDLSTSLVFYVFHDILWYFMIFYDISWYFMIFYDILWYFMIFYDILCILVFCFKDCVSWIESLMSSSSRRQNTVSGADVVAWNSALKAAPNWAARRR